MINNVLFALQLVFMAVFGCAQLLKLAQSDQGTSLSWIICWQGFATVLLLLALRAWREKPIRENKQLVIIYGGWITFGASWLSVMLIRGTATWNRYDSFNAAFALGITIVTMAVARKNGIVGVRAILEHPWVRAALAVTYKSVPQVVMAAQILMGETLTVAAGAVVAGHITVALRLYQTRLAAKKILPEKSRAHKAMFISEWGNEISWLAFTLVWWNS